jgi:UDP-hydrolysing UDP-N-acetyl-D-glucosamine 2-epimerase
LSRQNQEKHAKARRIAVVTVGRSDLGHYESLLHGIEQAAGLELYLMPTAAHFSNRYGETIRDIREQGYSYESGLESLLDADSAQGVAKSVGLGVLAFAQSFAQGKPDLLVVLGDRLEMLCAPIAAAPFNIPVAHLYGGKVTEGAIDELARHALTKMSHLHFVSCAEYERRVLQMGEEAWRVHNFGAPALDRMRTYQSLPKERVCAEVGLDPRLEYLLVTYHPVTLERTGVLEQIRTLLRVLDRFDQQVVFTFPNADLGSAEIIAQIEHYSAQSAGRTAVVENAGTQLYQDLMNHAAVMVGNSSSGIVEAASFALPVVNVGTRQDGAMRPPNVIDVGYGAEEIGVAIERALSAEFNDGIVNMVNPYGDGTASSRIVDVLASVELDDRLLRKKFVEL